MTVANDGAIRVSAATGGDIFDVVTGLTIDGKSVNGRSGNIGEVVANDELIRPVVAAKSARVRDNYRQLTVAFSGGVKLEVRAYDKGVAYRYTGLPAGSLDGERYAVGLAPATQLFYPEEDQYISHNERSYRTGTPSDFEGKLASLPALAVTPSGHHVFISEADLQHFPGLWLTATDGKLTGSHPALPDEIEDATDRDETMSRLPSLGDLRAGSRTPWRVFGVSPDAKGLLDNELVFLLSQPAAGDFSWVRPGQVAWDWYNGLNLKGVDFEAGVNTESYKYFIDFAADYGIPYIILDEGWSPTTELLETTKDIDLPAIMKYGERKGVGIILWVLWKPFVADLESICAKYREWGVKGVKVDFLQRDDQVMVDNYWRMARVAAENELLLDLHGSYKPAGLHRTYPNVITREGVKGLEVYKFGNESSGVGPDHNCTIPFTRQVAGPVDFTPGAMANAQEKNHNFVFDRPVSLGTRAHQLAMYVVFESPLQMLADTPTAYEAEPEVTRFITHVPTVWKQTVPLHGKVGDYAVVAREAHNGDWYVGGLNDWDARTLTVDLSFLPEGDYQLELFRDGPNHANHAEDYLREVIGVSSGQSLDVPLGKGGGWVGRFRLR